MGLIKTSLSPYGEIKDKMVSFKWSSNNTKRLTNTSASKKNSDFLNSYVGF
ncbi:hypothetical protein MSHv_03000 [Mycoplasmopsis synoviae]|nr:hypothetical protein MSHv_03000 [Mycoplasmopsis synoviae]AQU48097.1 hypothetical protein ADF19_03000 [Mycoplasmopsis synoviae]